MNPGSDGGPTIFALASGGGRSAVAIVRVSGPKVSDILCAITKSLPAPRVATLRRIIDPNTTEVIDHGVVLSFPGPHSFTGEDCAEFQVHGSRAIVAALLRVLGTFAETRIASPGEFARRAMANGKLDLIGVEALADLIDAETEQQRRLATIAGSGSLQKFVDRLRVRIIDLMAVVETELDFSDEGDRPRDTLGHIQGRLPEIETELRSLRSGQDRAELIREGLTVLIAGPPNAGKSSLLNGLARRDVAIVSEHAGTTRDIIEVNLDLGGFLINLVDSAGIRESRDPIEQEGIKRALAKSRLADLVLWLVPYDSEAVEPPAELLCRPLWRLGTKADLIHDDVVGSKEQSFPISIKNGLNVECLIDRLQEFADENMTVTSAYVLTNERQRNAIEMALDALTDAMRPNIPLELLAEDLRRTCFSLEILIGKVGVEDVLNSLFARFCIGK